MSQKNTDSALITEWKHTTCIRKRYHLAHLWCAPPNKAPFSSKAELSHLRSCTRPVTLPAPPPRSWHLSTDPSPPAPLPPLLTWRTPSSPAPGFADLMPTPSPCRMPLGLVSVLRPARLAFTSLRPRQRHETGSLGTWYLFPALERSFLCAGTAPIPGYKLRTSVQLKPQRGPKDSKASAGPPGRPRDLFNTS